MAGVWARSDGTRGVHKAPANEVVRGAISLELNITKGEHDQLNPVGINCIRSFPGRGIRVWGARTLSSDPAWRYINVRRLFNYLEESILEGTQWVVFEPNDMDLWERVKRTVNSFLVRVWRDGALFGATPAEAFYVKCDSENNPSETIDAGQLIVDIGVAPVKPAEFVVFRIAQFSGGTSLME
jgi:phage tail sheath protein FI